MTALWSKYIHEQIRETVEHKSMLLKLGDG
jgi:hypothetical protein